MTRLGREAIIDFLGIIGSPLFIADRWKWKSLNVRLHVQRLLLTILIDWRAEGRSCGCRFNRLYRCTVINCTVNSDSKRLCASHNGWDESAIHSKWNYACCICKQRILNIYWVPRESMLTTQSGIKSDELYFSALCTPCDESAINSKQRSPWWRCKQIFVIAFRIRIFYIHVRSLYLVLCSQKISMVWW